MYQVGQIVVYGMHGVCCITELEEKIIDRQKVQYYVLDPVDRSGSRFFIPVNNAAAASKLRPLLTQQQIRMLLEKENLPTDIWTDDENLRKQRYRELITGADRAALLSMILALLSHRKQQMDAGRKFHLSDENFLKDAQRLVGEEIAFVLGISQREAESRITDMIA